MRRFSHHSWARLPNVFKKNETMCYFLTFKLLTLCWKTSLDSKFEEKKNPQHTIICLKWGSFAVDINFLVQATQKNRKNLETNFSHRGMRYFVHDFGRNPSFNLCLLNTPNIMKKKTKLELIEATLADQ